MNDVKKRFGFPRLGGCAGEHAGGRDLFEKGVHEPGARLAEAHFRIFGIPRIGARVGRHVSTVS
jgi:hypothetical protein